MEPTLVHNFQRRLLKGKLLKAKRTLYKHEWKVSDKRNKLKQVLHHDMIPRVALYSKVLVHRVRIEVLSTQKKKLENPSKQQ